MRAKGSESRSRLPDGTWDRQWIRPQRLSHSTTPNSLPNLSSLILSPSSPLMKTFKIAVYPGDGIGSEVSRTQSRSREEVSWTTSCRIGALSVSRSYGCCVPLPPMPYRFLTLSRFLFVILPTLNRSRQFGYKPDVVWRNFGGNPRRSRPKRQVLTVCLPRKRKTRFEDQDRTLPFTPR